MPDNKFNFEAVDQLHAAANAAQGYGVTPQAATDALQSEVASGVPAAAGMHDPTYTAGLAKQQSDAYVRAQSPPVRSFVAAGGPAKAAAVSDSYTSLARIGDLSRMFGLSALRGVEQGGLDVAG